MFERFTNDARRVLVLATESSKSLGHFQINPAHLLIGLFNVPGSRELLVDVGGVNPAEFENHLKRVWPPAEHTPANPPFATEAKKVLEDALRHALKLKSKSITPIHLLLGVLSRPEGVDVEWLDSHLKGGVLGLEAEIAAHPPAVEELPGGGGSPGIRVGEIGRQGRGTPAMIIRQPVSTAAKQALSATEGTVDTGKLLLSLVKQQGSAAAQAIEKLGVTPDALAEAIAAVDTAGTPDEAPVPRAIRLIDRAGQSMVVEAGDLLRYAAERAADLASQGLATTSTNVDGSMLVELTEGALTDLLAGFTDWQAGRAKS